ncbi:MAG TPA: glycosyltransferase family 39 protein [Anaerolineaceae bacterium]|nr:glycosyltransferase family 39 protein [Anaerolineaceae bacterium]
MSDSDGSQQKPVEIEKKPDGAPPSRVDLSFTFPEGARLHVTVETLNEAGKSLGRHEYLFTPVDGQAPALHPLAAPAGGPGRVLTRAQEWARSRAITLDAVLLGAAVLLYLLTRLVGLADFPIYFFTDEAIQTVQAADLVARQFFGPIHEFLPTFFVNGGQYNLDVSVYLQVIPYLLFGKSVWVTRGVAVLASVFGALCLGLILRDIFKIRHGGWSGLLLLSIAPAWFLHSRTAFETTLGVSFYAAFLYFYLRYRTISPRSLYPALLLGGLAFYSYSPIQVVVVTTGLFLLFSDLGYHRLNLGVARGGLGILGLLALPYLRFLIEHPQANLDHLRILDSYWVQPLPLAEKLGMYFSRYIAALNPAYWYLPNEVDLPRHLMKGYGHILWIMFPFTLLGLALALRNIRFSPHRAVLFALLAAPTGTALSEIGITRLLVFLVPATLLAGLGLAAAGWWLEKRSVSYPLTAGITFTILALINVGMLSDALRSGPTWYSDYGLGGMQWGARQVFSLAQEALEKSPESQVIVSPTWANGTDEVARFFLPDDTPITLGTIDGYMLDRKPLDQRTLFVMTPNEYQNMLSSGKFAEIHVEQILNYPDGKPGFYFVRLQYSPNFDAMLEAEKEERRRLLTEQVTIGGEQIQVQYSRLDMGEIGSLFDGNPETLCRTLEANPMVVDLAFPRPRQLHAMEVVVGGGPTQATVRVSTPGGGQPLEFIQKVGQATIKRNLVLEFGGELLVTGLHLEILNVNDGEPAHVHAWEITLQ